MGNSTFLKTSTLIISLFLLSCTDGGFRTLSLNSEVASLASLEIGAPSDLLVKAGTVSFVVTYSAETDPASITLAGSDISFGGTAPAGCSVTSVTGTGLSRTVTIDTCSGTGTVSITVGDATASSVSGNSVMGAGPSLTFAVDNTGPNAPSVTLGSVPSNLTDSPTMTYAAVADVGGSTVDYYQARIIKTADSSVVSAWATHVSGADIKSLTLDSNTSYTAQVRAVDALGNLGTISSAVTWTSITVVPTNCGATPSPGDVCTGGGIYLGTLSPGATSGTGTDHYMTTPGGCGEIPAGQRVGAAGVTAYPNADFTPVCSGTDSLEKTWTDGNSVYTNAPGLMTYGGTEGTTSGAINTDANYGSTNTTNLGAITDPAFGGYHAAALYCDKLDYGGFTDWYLPNRYELNLMYVNRASIPGISTGSWYFSSSQFSTSGAWDQRFSDGYQLRSGMNKDYSELVRCVRRF